MISGESREMIGLRSLDSAPHVGDVPPADDQTIVLILRRMTERNQGVAVSGLLQRGDLPHRDEGTAVDPYELVTKFVFKMLERVIDQVGAVRVVHANIFLIRMEIGNVRYRNELQFTLGAGAHVLSPIRNSRPLRNLAKCDVTQAGGLF